MTAALDHHPAHAIGARTGTVAALARVAGGLNALARAIVNRRTAGRLHEMCDHELADIGLMRTDLVVAMNTPLGVDPTARLSRLACERHAVEDAARRAG